jgi:hypothetical protein
MPSGDDTANLSNMPALLYALGDFPALRRHDWQLPATWSAGWHGPSFA